MTRHCLHGRGARRWISSASAVAAVVLLSMAGKAGAFDMVACQLANGFDYPVGKPDSRGYHKARGFWPNGHLGEDWNGNDGGDKDLGDPIFAIGAGVVVLSEDVKVGWGNCVIVRHIFREPSGKIEMVDSLYGHLLERKVKVGEKVERGQLVGKMGNNSGMYAAHLHLEVRKNLGIGMNRSKFARDYSNYYSPSAFIQGHRQLAADYKKYEMPVNTFAPYGGELNREQIAFANSRGMSATISSGSSSSGRSSRESSGGSSVKRTAGGLSIPLTTSSRGKGETSEPTGAVITSSSKPSSSTTSTKTASSKTTSSKKGDKKKSEESSPTTVAEKKPEKKEKPEPLSVPDMLPPTEPKADFWTRLKSKLSNGEVFDPNTGNLPK